MSISAISSSLLYLQSTSTSGVTGAATGASSTSRGSHVPGHIAAAAEVLGMSTDEITEALSSGSSLADLAEEQGVSRDDLVAALVADAPQDMQAIGDIDSIIGNLVDQTGMGPAGGMPPAPPAAPSSTGVFGDSLTSVQQDTVDALSDLIGTDSTSLLESLRSGTSLTDLLTDAGVSVADLAGVFEDGILIDTTA